MLSFYSKLTRNTRWLIFMPLLFLNSVLTAFKLVPGPVSWLFSGVLFGMLLFALLVYIKEQKKA